MSMLRPITTKEHCFIKIYQLLTHIHPASHHGMEKRSVDMGPYVDYMIHLNGKFDPVRFKYDLMAYLIMNKFQDPYAVATWGPGQVILRTNARPDQWYDKMSFQIPDEVPSEQQPGAGGGSHL